MANLKRLSLLTAVALAVVGYAAVPASADITLGDGGPVYSDCVPGGSKQDCPIKFVRSGPATTFTAGSTVITCQTSNIDGVMDGDATTGRPASATLNFSWSQCTTNSLVGCSVGSITGVPFNILEGNAPSFTFVNTATFGTTITCAGVFVCNMSSNPATTPVTIEVDQASQVATINDTVAMTGSIGCPASGTGTWRADYLITGDADEDLDLSAGGGP
ncbi:MAG TPA: hypothetical protein VK486_08835 [Thermoleophilaceae bacterium]|nr:hypothetical protein [Thermoleophilaceae bacterium]